VYILLQIVPFKIRHNDIYQRISFWIFIITNFLGIIANLSDSIYYQITLKRTTAAIFQQFANEQNIGSLAYQFLLEYWYIDLIGIAFIALMVFLYQRIRVKKAPADNVWLYTLGQFIVMAGTVYMTVVGIRGGFRHSTRPITLSNASAYIEKPNQRAIVLNTPFSIFRTLKKNSLKEVNHFKSQKEQEQYFSALHPGSDTTMIKKNVVLFILESFGTEHIGALNKNIDGYLGYTPFLDSLINHSYTFKHSYANGRKSISGMPSVLASVPSLEVPFILSHYSGNEINSIASTLRTQGYTTSFYHGAPNGSMGFDAFANQAGFEFYFGKDEFNNDEHFDGIWGIWDEEFLAYFNNEMKKMQEPFCTALFSVSSHHPFKIPSKHEDKFPKGTLRIHQTIGYTDYALKKFFEVAQQSDWYENTIFVFTADHASTYSDINKYKTSLGTFTVPIIFFDPSGSYAGFDEHTVVQQSDIMPTLLEFLNYPKPFVSFGNNVFDNEADHFAINYVGDAYQFIMDGYMLQFNGENSIALYDINNDDMLMRNLLGSLPSVQKTLELKLKAFIQEYNRRLIRDEMVADR